MFFWETFAAIKCRFLQLYFGYIFILSGFLSYIGLYVLLPLRWIGLSKLHDGLTRLFCYLHWSLLLSMAQWWSDIRVNLYARPEVIEKLGKEKAVFIMNHKFQLDWLATWAMALNFGSLQDFKAVIKREVFWVPIIGWALWLSGSIFVERDSKTDKATLKKRFHHLTTLPHNYWLLLFCEGTRITPSKYAASVDYAVKNGLKPFKHHLMPRSKGFAVVRKALDGDAEALYDATVMCPGKQPPPLYTFASGQEATVDILIRRIPFDEVPCEDHESVEFLDKLYRYKDQLFDHYVEHEQFPLDQDEELSGFVKLPIKRCWSSFLITFGWSLLFLPPLFTFLFTFVFEEMSVQSVVAVFAFLLSVIILIRTMLRSGSASSAYGIKNS